MNILTTCVTGQKADQSVEVVWALGTATQGRLHVSVPPNVQDRDTVAELTALHHLLVMLAVFGNDRAGNALYLTVSSGAIRKLMQRRSTKTHLVPYSNFLATRFADASITVEPKAAWLKPRADKRVEVLELDSHSLEDEIVLRPFGRVALTRHALDQFGMRSNSPEAPSETWRAIRLILANRLEEVSIGEELVRGRIERHGVEGRIFYHADSRWNFVIAAAEGQRPRIVTAYNWLRKRR
ncbi:hypothetical protein [Niveibacterium sp. SC-1]|uniref:hypothetical protein n=1 Tax=Niveibacterium sp. SC-1 TaxID=3135646 RepID=UPI00311FAD60